jgi:L-threonylcarbamoyladenylate synthase
MEIIKCKGKSCKDCDLSEQEVDTVVGALRKGNLVVYPTETLYGLGANALDEGAVKRVFIAKSRPFDMPISIAVSDMQMIETVAVLDATSRKLVQNFMPGPITLVLKKKPKVPDLVTAATDEVGIRMPDHPLALKIIHKFGPITSTSANLHSHPDPVNLKNTVKEMGESVSVYLDCGSTKLGRHSTIIAVHDGEIEVVRQGVIPIKEIEAALHG